MLISIHILAFISTQLAEETWFDQGNDTPTYPTNHTCYWNKMMMVMTVMMMTMIFVKTVELPSCDLWTTNTPGFRSREETQWVSPNSERYKTALKGNVIPYFREPDVTVTTYGGRWSCKNVWWTSKQHNSEVWWSVAKCCSVMMVLVIRRPTLL